MTDAASNSKFRFGSKAEVPLSGERRPKRRFLFADGAFAFTRPVYRQFSAGFGIWGGIQPGLHRSMPGRVTYRVRPNIKVHVEWRQRLAGSAAPGSGPAVTLAGDF